MFEHETRIEFVTTRQERLRRDWSASMPARHVLGEWLTRLGRRPAPDPKPRSAFAHKALPRC